MEERLKRIEKFTKAMRELLAKMLEEDPDSSSNIYKEIWGAYTAGMNSLLEQQKFQAGNRFWRTDRLSVLHSQ